MVKSIPTEYSASRPTVGCWEDHELHFAMISIGLATSSRHVHFYRQPDSRLPSCGEDLYLILRLTVEVICIISLTILVFFVCISFSSTIVAFPLATSTKSRADSRPRQQYLPHQQKGRRSFTGLHRPYRREVLYRRFIRPLLGSLQHIVPNFLQGFKRETSGTATQHHRPHATVYIHLSPMHSPSFRQ